MAKVLVFNQLSLDGYFTDARGDMSWAHRAGGDPEWKAFTADNAKSESILLFGRVTYEMMASYWPTPQAAKDNPGVAEGINKAEKIVVSKSLQRADWNNTRILRSDLAGEVRKLKQTAKQDIVIMGSGTLVSQLTKEALIDVYQLVVQPIVLGAGRTLFAGVEQQISLTLASSRQFKNGNVVSSYERAA